MEPTKWKQDWIARILSLAWGLFVDKAYTYNRQGLQLSAVFERGAENAIQDAIQNDAFGYVLRVLMPTLEVPGSVWPVQRKIQGEKGVSYKMQDSWPMLDVAEEEYAKDTLRQVDLLVKDVLGAFNVLKKVKNREDDRAKILEVRAAREEKGLAREEEEDEERQDFATFVELVIALYQELPLDHDDYLWRDTKLIQAVGDVDGDGVGDKALLVRLFTAIGSGRGGSENLFAYLCKDDSGLSFSWISGALDHIVRHKQTTSRIAATALAARISGQVVAPIHDPEIHPVEAGVYADVCDVISTILKWHPQVSLELQPFHEILWKLINRNVPSRLASAMLGTLAAFASPSVYAVNPEAVKTAFASLRAYNVLTGKARSDATRPVAVFGSSVEEANSAWLTSIEENDNSEGTSAARQAVVKLFENLVVVSDSDEALSREAESGETRRKLAEYVVKGTFTASLATIRANNAVAGYPLLLAVLSFVQRSLAGLDLNRLLDASPSNSSAAPASDYDRLMAIQKQPGFVLLKAILLNQELREAILTAARIRGSLELPETVPVTLFTKISFRAVHIMRSVMAQQTILLDVIVPSLRRLGREQQQKEELLSEGIRPLDWYLAQQPETIAQIASYVAIEMPDGLARVSISLLASLNYSEYLKVPLLMRGRSIYGNLMASVFRDAGNSRLILAGFVDRLDNLSSQATPNSLLAARLVKDYDAEIESPISASAIQLEILDLLLINTQATQQEVTFAHCLLGFLDDTPGSFGLVAKLVRDGSHFGTVVENGKTEVATHIHPRTCFHAVVDRLAKVLPVSADANSVGDPLVLVDGAEVAARSTELLRQLVEHPVTGPLTSRYLRGQEDLVYRSLFHIPTTPVSTGHGEKGSWTRRDGSAGVCEGKDMVQLFRYQAEVLALVAMEIHHLGPDSDEIDRLVDMLLSGGAAQRTRILLDILSGFTYQWRWQDSSEPNSAGLETVNFGAYVHNDQDGQTRYDVHGVDGALRAEIRRISRKTVAEDRVADLEMQRQRIVAHLRRKNIDADLATASAEALKQWSNLLAAVLANRTAVPVTSILDLCESVLPALNILGEQDSNRIRDLSMGLMELSGKLADQLGNRSDYGSSDVSPERMRNIFAELATAIADGNKQEISRGLLYATITNFLKCLFSQIPESELAAPQTKETVAAVLQPISGDLERILVVISRDAISGNPDWQMVSYTLLDELLVSLPGEFANVVQILARRGILHNILGAVVAADSSIIASIQPDSGEHDLFWGRDFS